MALLQNVHVTTPPKECKQPKQISFPGVVCSSVTLSVRLNQVKSFNGYRTTLLLSATLTGAMSVLVMFSKEILAGISLNNTN